MLDSGGVSEFPYSQLEIVNREETLFALRAVPFMASALRISSIRSSLISFAQHTSRTITSSHRVRAASDSEAKVSDRFSMLGRNILVKQQVRIGQIFDDVGSFPMGQELRFPRQRGLRYFARADDLQDA